MTAYRTAQAAHQDAIERGDTRAQHQTAGELRKAMTERLKREQGAFRRLWRWLFA